MSRVDKMRKLALNRTWRWIAGAFAVLALLAGVYRSAADLPGVGAEASFPDEFLHAGSEFTYAWQQQKWRQSGVRDVSQGTETVIRAAQTSARSPEAIAEVGRAGGRDGVLKWTNGAGWIDYRMEVPESGLYQIGFDYMPLSVDYTGQESRGTVIRSLMVDGVYPFAEARLLELKRSWKYETYPPKLDSFGNQIRPGQVQEEVWSSWAATDYRGDFSEPYRFFLSKGEHVLRLEAVAEPVALDRIVLRAPASPLPYPEAKAAAGDAPQGPSGFLQVIEAENTSFRSDTTIQLNAGNDAGLYPETSGKVVYNIVGGSRWNKGGMWAEWEFEVPADGSYKIAFAYIQNLARGVNSFRTLMIDGKVPYAEMLNVAFPYGSTVQGKTLATRSDEPLYVKLAKGKHTLRLEATGSPNRPAAEAIEQTLADMRSLDEKVKMVTGVGSNEKTIDKAMNWRLETYIPDLAGRIAAMIDRLELAERYLISLHGKEMRTTYTIRPIVSDLRLFMNEPNALATSPQRYGLLLEQLANTAAKLREQPLFLDRIFIASPDTDIPRVKPTLVHKIARFIGNFFLTFTSGYAEQGRKVPDALNVWVMRGRDYVNLLQEMVDQEFTPQTGIKVNVNLMPNSQILILGNAAGIQPDVALGIGEGMPVDFAMRGALVNLNGFPDYPEVAKRFLPGALLPFHYDHSDWALPEIQNFNLMFYRKDILQKLKLSPPDTWSDVYKMLPVLQQNQMNFYVPPEDITPFLYQQGGEFYSADGLHSGLNSPEAFRAFKQLTDFSVLYGLDKNVNFFQHFRYGMKPIGISDLNTYIQLTVAAPELTGIWGVAPLPGYPGENGEIRRWAGGSVQSGVMFQSSERKPDAWSFLKWWTSEETQTRYGIELESFNGTEYRWNTANMKAFFRQSWPENDKRSILEQFRWYKDIPYVPGGYFTTRSLNFAWNKTVVDGQNYRDALEAATKDIDKEVYRKQQEFGFIDAEGRIVRELDVPLLNKPWNEMTTGKEGNLR